MSRVEEIRERHEKAKPYPAFTNQLGDDLGYLLQVAERARAYVRAIQESNFTGYEFTDETRAEFKSLVRALETETDE